MTGRGRRSERGLAMVYAAVLLAVVTVIVAVGADRATRVQRERRMDTATMATRLAARGGLEQARWALSRDPAYAGERIAVDGTEVTISVQHLDDAWSVTCAAVRDARPVVADARCTVDAQLAAGERALPRVVSYTER